MATGIDTLKINKIKIELLDCIEAINSFVGRLENNKLLIENNFEGSGKKEIIAKLDAIIEQMPIVIQNINTYIVTLDKVVQKYVDQDSQLASTVINIHELGN